MRKSEDFKGSSDVVILGGGVAGLAVARALGQKGLSVTLFERGETGAGASSAAAGMLAPQAEADTRDEFFDFLCASRELYPAFASALLEESGIDVELERTGTLYLAFTDRDVEEVERRYEWQERAGLAVERLSGAEARCVEPAVSERVRLALRFPRDWQVENRLLVRALALSAERFGVRVLNGTEVLGVRVERGRASGVRTSRGAFGAGAVVLAAGAWSSRVPLLHETTDAGGVDEWLEGAAEHPPVEPVRGQMLCFRREAWRETAAGAALLVRHVVYSPRGYIVPRRDGRLLAGSTTEHAGFDCSVTPAGRRAVETHALEISPEVGGLTLADSWAGLRPRATDERPLLGESDEVRGLFYATGHYRNGILLAPATGELMAALVEGRATGFAPRALEAFSPARFRRALVASHEG
jgi:glycine oxidase